MGKILKNRVLVIIVLLICICFSVIYVYKENDEIKTICVEGFELEYYVNNMGLSIKDFENLQFDSSLKEIIDIIGEPDAWIGSGVIRPVYFISGGKAVVLSFEYPAHFTNLRKIVVYNKKGEVVIKKEK